MGEATPRPLGTGGTIKSQRRQLPRNPAEAWSGQGHACKLGWHHPREPSPHRRDLVLGSRAASAAGTGLARPRPGQRNRRVRARGHETAPRLRLWTGRTRADGFCSTPRGRCHIQGTWLWGLVEHPPRRTGVGEPKALVAHRPTGRAPTTGCSCSDHTGYDESPSPEHEIGRRRTRPEGKRGLDPPSMPRGDVRPCQVKHAHCPPEGGRGPRSTSPLKS